MEVVALLWTWLERHLTTLGGLEEKPPAIFSAALAAHRKKPYKGIDDDLLKWLSRSPLRNAAELLARLAHAIETRDAPLLDVRKGIDDTEVIVALRRPNLAIAMEGSDGPPGMDENPSLSTLAPRLLVCPLNANEMQLEIVDSDSLAQSWNEALAPLECRQSDPPIPDSICVHLDTLGESGLSGLKIDGERGAALFDSEEIDADDQARCIAAAEEAIRRAEGPRSILLMPELAATPPVVEAVKAGLRKANEGEAAPAITVLGLYHRVPDELPGADSELFGEARAARYVNEAVALAPSGSELWRQRKLSCAGGEDEHNDEGGGNVLVEPIHLGRQLRLVATPLGTIAIVICLDSFRQQTHDLLARSPADLLLVPSLSPSARRHYVSLRHLVQVLWGAAFVCNRSPFPRASEFNKDGRSAWNDDRNRSFWVVQRGEPELPVAKGENDHPSFVFCLDGEGGSPTKRAEGFY